METNCANKIIKELQSILPSDWEKVFFCMEYEEGTFSADCFVFLENELKPIRSIDICSIYGVKEKKLLSIYSNIHKILYKKWKESGKGHANFSHYMLSFNNTDFLEEFDYRTLSETFGFVDFWEEWKHTKIDSYQKAY